jgi:murein DD-endopeptidase MepM/ murein hydrolase activator NlpD
VKNVTLGDWRTHDGVDIAAEKGADVLAAAAGTVSAVEHDALWGTVITLDHTDGRQTLYCGLSGVTPVQAGDAVLSSQVIGSLDGVPCEISDPNHLHFAMKEGGRWVDPLAVMQ